MEVIVQHYLLSWNVIIDKKQSWSDTEQNRTDTQSVIWMTSTIMASILKKYIRNSHIVSDWFLSFVYPEVVRKTTTKQRTKQRTNKYKKTATKSQLYRNHPVFLAVCFSVPCKRNSFINWWTNTDEPLHSCSRQLEDVHEGGLSTGPKYFIYFDRYISNLF